MGDKALRVVDGAIFVAKSAPLGTAVKVSCVYSIEINSSQTFAFGAATAAPGPIFCHAPERAIHQLECSTNAGRCR